MEDNNVTSIAQLREFLKLSNSAAFSSTNTEESYAWIDKAYVKFRYRNLKKKEKGVVKKYIRAMTGYSDTQVDRLLARKRDLKKIVKLARTQPTFTRIYTSEDSKLLSEVDNAEGRRTGGALKKTLHDMYHVYGDKRFERLANISVAHIYNLRGTKVYETSSLTYTKTSPTPVNIGIRKKPQPEDRPGFLRVDSVHQGDSDGKKGVYHINLVDEVTQEEVVTTVEGISEYFLLPALEAAMEQFHCKIINFHSDNGSEYINKRVANLLNKLIIEQTKSRPRHTNDNPLVEGKNNFVVRKNFGYSHIPKKFADLMEEFNRKVFNPYNFFHRQCVFADNVIDERGKVKKVYKEYMTSCEKLLSVPNVEQYLKDGVTVDSLKKQMMEKTHFAAAKEMRDAKDKLFAKIRQKMV